jgi:hypothetical protein
MKFMLLGLLLAGLATAATRNVNLVWSASADASIVAITYNVFRCQVIAPAVKCVPGTLLNTGPITSTNFVDSNATVGLSYMYGAEAVAPACVSGSSKPCGVSILTETAEPITINARPAQPCTTCKVSLTITGVGMIAVVE